MRFLLQLNMNGRLRCYFEGRDFDRGPPYPRLENALLSFPTARAIIENYQKQNASTVKLVRCFVCLGRSRRVDLGPIVRAAGISGNTLRTNDSRHSSSKFSNFSTTRRDATPTAHRTGSVQSTADACQQGEGLVDDRNIPLQ